MAEDDHIYSQHPDTGKWAIGEGMHTYHTRESAAKAYTNYLKRGGKPVEPKKK